MDRAQRIIALLTNEFQPSLLELQDDSKKHAGHAGASAGGESHYNLTIISEKFEGIPVVRRHQAIYKILGEEFATGLHALSIKAMAPEESKT